MKKTKINLPAVFFILVFILAFSLRIYGLNWDQGQHLHPDERFLTMVTNTISWPDSLWQYLNTSSSPLNPQNRGFGFFVYGTFPIFFTKFIAESLNLGDYANLTLVGRWLSAAFDLGTLLLVYLIAKTIINSKNKKNTLDIIFPLLSMFFYASLVLPIQLSHFYAVDTYLTFFITLSFHLDVKLLTTSSISTNAKYQIDKNLILLTLLGISFGLALASKISAVLFLPIIILLLLFKSIQTARKPKKSKNIFRFLYVFLLLCFCFLIFSYLTLRFTQPYLFTNPNIFDIKLNQKVLANWKQLKSFDDPKGLFPPSIQWIKTRAYLFPFKNMVLWGLGIPAGIILISAVIYAIISLFHYFIVSLKFRVKKQLNNSSNFAVEKIGNNDIPFGITLIILWIFLLFTYQGAQFVKALRYFYPIYPFVAILNGFFIYKIFQIIQMKYQVLKSKYKKHKSNVIHIFAFSYVSFIFAFLFLILIYPLSFISIYSRSHTRVQASRWIYQNIPPGITRSGEHWDDFLPLSLPTPGYIHEKYKSVELPLYGADTQKKWEEMADKLKRVDYIILSSNRLYGSIMTVPEKYPITYQYYQALFDGSLGFEKVAEFTSRPNIPIPFIRLCLTPPFSHYGAVAKRTQECPLPGITFVDDYADETFTVYDHPKVIIFKKVKTVDYFSILYMLNPKS